MKTSTLSLTKKNKIIMNKYLNILTILITCVFYTNSYGQINNEDPGKKKDEKFFYLTVKSSEINESFILNAKKNSRVKDISIIQTENFKTTIKVLVFDDVIESTDFVQDFCIKNELKTVFIGNKEIACSQITNFVRSNPNYATENRQIEK